jgi:hypothetical protein
MRYDRPVFSRQLQHLLITATAVDVVLRVDLQPRDALRPSFEELGREVVSKP